MFHFSIDWNRKVPQARRKAPPIIIPRCIAIPFAAGITAGSVVGLFSETQSVFLSSFGMMSSLEVSSFFSALWYSSRFILLAVLLATCVLGVVLLPLLAAFRGFLFSCSVATLIQPLGIWQILSAFISLGIPALFSFPAFLLAETDAFLLSRHLLFRVPTEFFHDKSIPRHFLLVLLLCIFDAAYILFLFPLLRALLF